MSRFNPITMQIIEHADSGMLFRAELQFLYVLRGSVDAEIGNKKLPMTTGGMLIINPFIYHHIDCSAGASVLLFISQDMLQLTGLFRTTRANCHVADAFPGKQGEYDQLRVLFSHLFKLFSQDAGQDSARLVAATSQLLSFLSEKFSDREQPEAQHEDSADSHERYIRLMTYIHDNWREPITIKQLAQQEYLSAGYLSRFFKQCTGSSLTDYLTELRLQHVAHDLETKTGTIAEIALADGFKNVNSFIEKFKIRFGQTPKLYRKQLQNRIPSKEQKSPEHSIQAGINLLLQYADREHTPAIPIPNEHLQIKIDAAAIPKALRHTWRRLLNIGYARDGLLAEVQSQLRIAQETIGFEYLRFHGILDDDMHIYHEDRSHNPYLDFSRVDLLLDFVLSIELKPYIELSFMPRLLAQKELGVYDRQSVMSKYRDEEKWRFLICGLVQHCIDRYGRNQVRKWRFTANGNNLVSAGILRQEDFLDIYRTTYESVKSVDRELSFGGPGGMSSSLWGSTYIHDFLKYTSRHRCVPDFINMQCQPHRAIEQDHDFLTFTMSQESSPAAVSDDEHYTKTMLQACRQLLGTFGLSNREIWIDEWNSTLWQRDPANDTCYKSSWLAMNLCDIYDEVEAVGYWLLTDFIEERADFGNVFHGGYGLFTYNGIPKCGWRTLELMKMLGSGQLAAGDGWMATTNAGEIQILLSHYCHYDKLYRCRYQRLTDAAEAYTVFVEKGRKEYAIRIDGITPGQYEIRKYKVSRAHGSSFDTWLDMGAPKYLSAGEVSYLKNASQPRYHIQTKRLSKTYTFECSLEPHEVWLIVIRPL